MMISYGLGWIGRNFDGVTDRLVDQERVRGLENIIRSD